MHPLTVLLVYEFIYMLMTLEGRWEWQGCVFVGKEEGENQNRRRRIVRR